ncbi:BnaAnng21240D [Brassica napus]|uniref:BnaAnng21240D protein n=1 Tax=Brassica napus TaxID=3708 RepID=A0A078JGQ4_BRANA|nr:BnaAnng21240D [Brassica napus]
MKVSLLHASSGEWRRHVTKSTQRLIQMRVTIVWTFLIS